VRDNCTELHGYLPTCLCLSVGEVIFKLKGQKVDVMMVPGVFTPTDYPLITSLLGKYGVNNTNKLCVLS